MRRIGLLAVTLGIALSGLQARAQDNPNIKDLKDALEYLKSDKSTDRAFALATMGLMKGDARTASKDIVKGFFDSSPDVRQAANLALMNVNPDIYKPVVTLATSNDYDAKVAAVKGLAKLGTEAGPTTPAMLSFLKDAKPGEKVEIIKTLLEVAPKDESLAPVLTQLALKDSDEAVRQAALKALPKSADAAGQVNTVVAALNGAQTPEARITAIGTLAAVGKGNQEVVVLLKGYLADTSPKVREAAQKALKTIQEK
jgi:HEAT repeat protein